jgi:hypothetical protein
LEGGGEGASGEESVLEGRAAGSSEFEPVDDGPALGVEEARVGEFAIGFRDGEEAFEGDPAEAGEELGVVGGWRADDGTAGGDVEGGVELGGAFFEPNGEAVDGVVKNAVDVLVGEDPGSRGGAGLEDDPIDFGGALVEAGGGGAGAEGVEVLCVAEGDDASGDGGIEREDGAEFGEAAGEAGGFTGVGVGEDVAGAGPAEGGERNR